MTRITNLQEFADVLDAAMDEAFDRMEIARAVRESRAAFRPVWDAMTNEERANWIMGIDSEA